LVTVIDRRSWEGAGLGSKVELFAAIRRDARVEGLSVRALAMRYRVHRRTVRQALESAQPPARKSPQRSSPALEPVRDAIDAMLREDVAAPRKQQHTARRVFERLVDEHGARLSYSTVVNYVWQRRPQIVAEARARAGVVDGFVPQTHGPGRDAEVDFAEVWVRLVGVMTKCHLFTLRMSFSGKAIHRVYPSQGQEAFFEGHVAAFEELGGVPCGQIRYDNLKPAVYRVCFGRNRAESQRWIMFRSHHGIDAFYCIPGQEGAHEKGGVEGEVGRFRRRWFVPVPDVASLAELNARLAQADACEDARHVDGRAATIGSDFAVEAPLLAPLSGEAFDCALTLTPKVDRYARIPVRQCRYSVPARLIGRRVRVKLSASTVAVFDGSARVAEHDRLVTRGGEHLVLDHYLEILAGKPGALPGSTPLAQARADGSFTAAHEALWAAARAKHGDTAGTRALIEVLLLHRRMPRAQVLAGITATLAAGSVSPDVVAIEARKAAVDLRPDTSTDMSTVDRMVSRPRRSPARLVTLPARRNAAQLPPDARPAPSVADYDQLLTRTPTTPPGRAS
jgi:transposase